MLLGGPAAGNRVQMASTSESPEVLNLPYLFSCLLSVAAILIRYLSFSDSCVLVAVLGARRKARICLSRCHTGRVPSFFYGPNMDLIPIPTPSSIYYGSATLLYHFDRMFTSRITPEKNYFFFIRLKSKQNLSAISDEFFPKSVNIRSK